MFPKDSYLFKSVWIANNEQFIVRFSVPRTKVRIKPTSTLDITRLLQFNVFDVVSVASFFYFMPSCPCRHPFTAITSIIPTQTHTFIHIYDDKMVWFLNRVHTYIFHHFLTKRFCVAIFIVRFYCCKNYMVPFLWQKK